MEAQLPQLQPQPSHFILFQPLDIIITTYEHEPLDKSKKSIRLIRVLTLSTAAKDVEENNEQIQIELIQADLDETPGYIALSYTWDQGHKHEDIVCNGPAMRIGRNLWAFLHEYRQREMASGNLLWVDAICEFRAPWSELLIWGERWTDRLLKVSCKTISPSGIIKCLKWITYIFPPNL